MLFHSATQRTACVKCVCLLALLTAALPAQTTTNTPDLTDLSLDQLSNIKVTSFANKEQQLSQVAAAVYVITQEQIVRSGLTSVPELLRLAPGLDVQRVNGNQWSIAARGFDGVYANKLLVLVDGRSIYSPIFSGVYWEMGMPMLEDIDRIEVIRGPGATIWGANAVLGVINIITKKTSDTQGTLITAGGGSEERALGGVRFGGSIGSSTTYRASFFASDRSQLEQENGLGAHDASTSEQGGFRIDHSGVRDHWMLEGNLFHSSIGEVGTSPSLQAQAFVPILSNLDLSSADLTGEWRRRFGDHAELRFRSYYDYASRPEPQASVVSSRNWDNELQYDFIAGRHNFSVGTGERLIETQESTQGYYTFAPTDRDYLNANAFVQDEVHFLHDSLVFTAGAKLEHNHLGGWAGEPSANLIWIPTKHHSLWTSVARAVRTPSLFEEIVTAAISIRPASPLTGGLPTVIDAIGSSAFSNELVDDYETGYRGELTKRLTLDVSLFYDRDSHLRSFSPGAPSVMFGGIPYLSYPLTFANGLEAVGKGAEGAISWQMFHDWKLAGSYTYNAVRTWDSPAAPLATEDGSGAKPTHTKFKLQSYWNPTKPLQFDSFLYWTSQVDPYSASGSVPNIPSYWRFDVRVGYRINPHWQVSLSGQNLLQPRHLEGVPELLTQYSYVTRGAYLKSTWQF